MNRPNLIRVIVVFMAGLLITLGSLIFSRAQELNHFRKAARSAAAARVISGPEVPKPIGSLQGAQGGSSWPVPEATQEQKLQSTKPKEESPGRVQVPAVPAQTAQPDSSSKGPSEDGGGMHAPIIIESADARDVPLEPRPTEPEGATSSRRTPRIVTLQPGTNLNVRLGQNLSTDHNHAGDAFRGTLDSPLTLNGIVLAQRGSIVRGEVLRARRARLLGAKSNLSLILTEISTSDGQHVQVETNLWEEKGTGKSIEDTPRMAAGAALGAVMGALHSAARGAGFVSSEEEPVSDRPIAMKKGSILLRAGSRIEFRLASAVTITEKLNHR